MIVGIGIDIFDDPDLAGHIDALTKDHLGDGPIRIGRWPKRLRLYRVNEPLRYLREGLVEILAAGRQFVAAGVHPDTGKSYDWPGTDIQNLNFKDLTEITEKQIQEYLVAVKAALPQKSYKCGNRRQNNNNGIVTLDIDAAGVIGTADTAYGPFLVYWQTSYNRLRAAQCQNTSCSAWNFSDLDSGITNNPYPSVAINNNGMPVIAYYDAGNGDLKVVACSSQNCWPGIGVSSGTLQPISIVDSSGNVGTNSSIAIQSNNNPVIAYYDSTNGTLKVAECTTSTCSNATIKTIGSAGNYGRMSIAIGNDGIPIVAYIDGNDLKLAVVPVS